MRPPNGLFGTEAQHAAALAIFHNGFTSAPETQANVERVTEISHELLEQAITVQRCAPELAERVLAGALGLREAYQLVCFHECTEPKRPRKRRLPAVSTAPDTQAPPPAAPAAPAPPSTQHDGAPSSIPGHAHSLV